MAFGKKLLVSILSSLLILAGIELSLRALGERHIAELEASKEPAPEVADGLRILFLGESTTAWGLANSYPAVLGRLIRNKYPGKTIHIINEGIPATDTGKILARLDSLLEKYKPQVVFTMMGVNDFWAISEEEDPGLLRELKKLRIYKLADQIKARWKNKERLGIEPSVPPPKQYPISSLTPGELQALQATKSAMARNDLSEASRLIAGCWKDLNRAPPQCLAAAGKVALRSGDEIKAQRLFDLAARKSRDPDEIYGFASEYSSNFGASNPAHVELIRRYSEAALRLDPLHPLANWAMGCLVENRAGGRGKNGIRHLLTAAEAGLVRGDLYACLGDLQMSIGDFHGAIESWKKGVEVNDVNQIHLYQRLIKNLLEAGQSAQAREILAEAELRLPGNSALIEIRYAAGKELGEPSGSVTYGYGNFLDYPPTRRNYRAIAERLLKENVAVFAVQYPNISAQPLREILSGLPVLVVSNEENFARALERDRFDQYFVDVFAERFGHFSADGSRLVAETALRAMEERGLLSNP